MHKPGRILLGFLIGTLGGAIVGFITGYVTELIATGGVGRYIVILTPLFVPAEFLAALEGITMLFAGAILGLAIGPITAAINRPRVGWLIGPCVGVIGGMISILFGNKGKIDLEILIDTTIIGTLVGLLVTIMLVRLPHVSISSSSNVRGISQILQTSADSSSRTKLSLWIGSCLFAILLAAFFMATGEDYLMPLMIIAIIIFGAIGTYNGYMLRIKKN